MSGPAGIVFGAESFSRRSLLGAVAAGVAGGGLAAASDEQSAAHSVTLRAGDLEAVIGDNAAEGSHRAGYNGVWSLKHRLADRSLFVPGIAGLNLEHIVNGTPIDTDELFFEPRRAPNVLDMHNDQSTVRHRSDDYEAMWDPDQREALFRNFSRLRLDAPFFYGNFGELMWGVLFDRSEGIRLTHSPSGGGFDSARRTSNPAWDFQFLIRNPEINVARGFAVRTILSQAINRDALPDMVADWQRKAMNRP